VKYLLIGFVRLWRALISPLYGDVCKYHPSCSAYGLRALQEHGAIKGSWLTITRILRCNPWSLGGYDPVPGTPEALAWQAEQAQYSQAEQAQYSQAEQAQYSQAEQARTQNSSANPAGTPDTHEVDPCTC